LLAKRLSGHGLTFSVGALATMLCQHAASAVSPVLAAGTIKAAGAFHAGNAAGLVSGHVALLTKRVLASMLLSKLKLIACVPVVMGMLGLGAGLLTHQEGIAQPAPPGSDVKDSPTAAPKNVDEPGHLRFGYKAGEKYFYSMRLEAKLAKGTSEFTRVGQYGVAARDDLQNRYDLLAEGDHADECLRQRILGTNR
jgi:hypothetical protein